MAKHVCQRFLKNPEKDGGLIFINSDVIGMKRDLTFDSASLPEFFSLPLKGRPKTKMVQEGRPQLCTNPFYGQYGRVDNIYACLHLFRKCRVTYIVLQFLCYQ